MSNVPATNPGSWITNAIERGLGGDELRSLLDVYQQWQTAESGKAFAVAMHAAQQDMPAVVRDSVNSKTQSRYAKLETVQLAAKPIYSRHGFALSYGEEDCHIPGHKRTVCDVSHVGGCVRRYHIDLPIDGIGPKGNPIGGMNTVQGEISTMSYGHRKLLCLIFNIAVADEDDDGQALAAITGEQFHTLQSLYDEWAPDDESKELFLGFTQIGCDDDGTPRLWELSPLKYDKTITTIKNKISAQIPSPNEVWDKAIDPRDLDKGGSQ